MVITAEQHIPSNVTCRKLCCNDVLNDNNSFIFILHCTPVQKTWDIFSFTQVIETTVPVFNFFTIYLFSLFVFISVRFVLKSIILRYTGYITGLYQIYNLTMYLRYHLSFISKHLPIRWPQIFNSFAYDWYEILILSTDLFLFLFFFFIGNAHQKYW